MALQQDGLNHQALLIIQTATVHFMQCHKLVQPESQNVAYLSHEVVVDAVFEGSEDDDGPRELEVDLLHRLVGQDRGREGGGRRAAVLSASPASNDITWDNLRYVSFYRNLLLFIIFKLLP